MATESRIIDRVTLLNITFFVEAILLLSATFWSHLESIQLLPCLKLEPSRLLLGAGCGLVIASVSLTIIWLGKNLGLLSDLREITIQQIAPLFRELNLLDLIMVSAVSGLCEEILFRGVMQQQFGLLATSLVFGLFHCPSLRFISYGLWVFAAGLVLGWLYLHTGNLWVPIMAHGVSNAVSLCFVRYGVKVPPESAK